MLLSHHSQVVESRGFAAVFSPYPQQTDSNTWYIGFNSIAVKSTVPIDQLVVLETSLVYNSTRLFGIPKPEPLHVFRLKTEEKEPDVHVAVITLNATKLFNVTSLTNPVTILLAHLDHLKPFPPEPPTPGSRLEQLSTPPPPLPAMYVHFSMYKTL